MEDYEMSPNTKLEVAVEILAAKIAHESRKGLTIEDEEIKKLLNERERLYSGDKKILDKIIDVYGPEMKKIYEEG